MRPCTGSVLNRAMMERNDAKELTDERARLVDRLRGKGIANERVLEAILRTPRHEFVPQDLRHEAYADAPLPIGRGQTISQPWVVARMTELLLEPSPRKVLEVGTGSGYQAAVLARLVDEVFSVERIASLAEGAKKVFRRLGLKNIRTMYADGCGGWESEAPFDGIMLTAGARNVPKALYPQLGEGGRLVMPVGHFIQRLLVSDFSTGARSDFSAEAVRFVPLLPGVE